MRIFERPLSKVASTWTLSCATLLATACASTGESPDEDEEVGAASSPITVQEAVGSSCSTMSVRGLSLQIIEQANCIEPGAFEAIPPLPNVTMSDSTFAFLEAPAKDAFVQAANDKPGMHLTINSMLRTVAQQLLLYRWYQNGTCGIGLAATPGSSNHETGLAFDTSDYSAWKSTLEARGFHWFGSQDTVHFDYAGAGAVNYKGTDVLAFQQLWNKNHPDDPIDEDGVYGPQTEARLLASPADGFDVPPSCETPDPRPDIAIGVGFDDATDDLRDGPSAGVVDLFETEPAHWVAHVTNLGQGAAADVVVSIDLASSFEPDAPAIDAVDYRIEVGTASTGPFTEDAANAAPENPSHDAPLGVATTLHLGSIEPGEEKRISLTLVPRDYTVERADPVALRAWVQKVDDLYAETDFGGEVTNVDGSQTFQGGRLEVAQAVDVYSHLRWEWQSPRLEGATASSGVTFSSSSTSLDTSGTDDGAAIVMRGADLVVDETATISLRASRSGAEGDAAVLVARDADDLATATSFPLDLAADGAMHEASVTLPAGPIKRIAIVPFAGAASGAPTASLDYVRIDGARVVIPEPGEGGAPGAGGGSGEGGATDGDDTSDLDGSCSCRAAGQSREGAPASLFAMAFGAALAMRRRHRR